MLTNIYKIFVKEQGLKWVIVAGDAKTFDLLQVMGRDYSPRLKWMIPFPGDWHVLYNYQKVLMKAFADGRMKHLGNLSGH